MTRRNRVRMYRAARWLLLAALRGACGMAGAKLAVALAELLRPLFGG